MNAAGLLFLSSMVILAIVATAHDAAEVRRQRKLEERRELFSADKEREEMNRAFAEWSVR